MVTRCRAKSCKIIFNDFGAKAFHSFWETANSCPAEVKPLTLPLCRKMPEEEITTKRNWSQIKFRNFKSHDAERKGDTIFISFFTHFSGHSYIQNSEDREEAGTPDIVGCIRTGPWSPWWLATYYCSSLPLTRSGVPLAHLAAGESLRGCGKFSEIGCTLNWIHKPTGVGGMQKRPLVPLQILSTQWLGYTRSTVKSCLWWEKNPTEKTGVSDAFWCISGSVAASCLIYCRQKFKVFIICWSDGSAIRVSCHTNSHTKLLAFTGMLQVRTWPRASLEFVLRLRNSIEMCFRWMFDHVSPFSWAMFEMEWNQYTPGHL